MGTIVGIVVGAVLTLLISRYYFKKDKETVLRLYVHQVTRLFEGVDDDLRHSLQVLFKDALVSDLVDIRLLIANEGTNSIHDYLAPLTVELPSKARFLDASILYVHPEGRKVRMDVPSEPGARISFEFAILNPGEFFLVRILLDGRVGPRDLKYAIEAQDLPPYLEPRYGSYSTEKQRGAGGEWVGAAVGLFCFGLSAAIGWTLTMFHSVQPNWIPFLDHAHPGSSVLKVIALAVVAFVAVFFGIVGFLFISLAALGGSVPRERVFPMPRHLRRTTFVGRAGHEFFESAEEYERYYRRHGDVPPV